VIAVTGSMPVADVVAEIVPLPSKGKPPFIGVALEVRAQSKVTVAALPDTAVMTSGKRPLIIRAIAFKNFISMTPLLLLTPPAFIQLWLRVSRVSVA
jgi:hypothetical protein